MVQGDLWFAFYQVLDLADLSFSFGFLVPLQVHLLGSDFLDEGIERQEIDILEVIIGPVVFLKLLGRLPRIDTLQDTQSPEVLEGEL